MNRPISYLKKIQKFFQESTWDYENYNVPNLWLKQNAEPGFSTLHYNDFYIQKLGEILEHDKHKFYNQSLSKINDEQHGIGGDWSYHSVVYNAFPRLTAAYDHNNSGDLADIEFDGKTIKKTGTFLKMITK